jgi:hypothetical protein
MFGIETTQSSDSTSNGLEDLKDTQTIELLAEFERRRRVIGYFIFKFSFVFYFFQFRFFFYTKGSSNSRFH